MELTELAQREVPALYEFAKRSVVPAGFGYLDSTGQVLPDQGAQLWINCRMTHILSLAALQGHPGARELAAHGVASLLGPFQDHQFGGWFSQIENELDAQGNAQVSHPTEAASFDKESYAHAFVVLAGASATVAGIERGKELLDAALQSQEDHWWEEDYGRVREKWNRDWTKCENYRGANANMHTVEAYLAAFDATGNELWLGRALSIAEKLINGSARAFQWQLPEHYGPTWEVDLDYNRDEPNHPFRPWGATPGHALEWSRLLMHLHFAWLQHNDQDQAAISWIPQAVAELLENTFALWGADGNAGFVYTTDFEGHPISRVRMHWVHCEALGAALVGQKYFTALADQSAAERCRQHSELLADYIQQYLIAQPGRWYHELDVNNEPANTVWLGMPDVYHATQAMLLVGLPVWPGFARALGANSKL